MAQLLDLPNELIQQIFYELSRSGKHELLAVGCSATRLHSIALSIYLKETGTVAYPAVAANGALPSVRIQKPVDLSRVLRAIQLGFSLHKIDTFTCLLTTASSVDLFSYIEKTSLLLNTLENVNIIVMSIDSDTPSEKDRDHRDYAARWSQVTVPLFEAATHPNLGCKSLTIQDGVVGGPQDTRQDFHRHQYVRWPAGSSHIRDYRWKARGASPPVLEELHLHAAAVLFRRPVFWTLHTLNMPTLTTVTFALRTVVNLTIVSRNEHVILKRPKSLKSNLLPELQTLTISPEYVPRLFQKNPDQFPTLQHIFITYAFPRYQAFGVEYLNAALATLSIRQLPFSLRLFIPARVAEQWFSMTLPGQPLRMVSSLTLCTGYRCDALEFRVFVQLAKWIHTRFPSVERVAFTDACVKAQDRASLRAAITKHCPGVTSAVAFDVSEESGYGLEKWLYEPW